MMKRPTRFSFILLAALILVLLLYPFTRGEAQSSDGWLPTWADLNDPDTLHVEGFDPAAHPKLVSPLPPTSLDRPASGGLLEAVSGFFSSLFRSFTTPASQTDGWVTIFGDDFEGAFPGDWYVFDNDVATYGEYYWSQENCRPNSGSYSAWSVGGGANGSALPCSSNYLNDTKSWMIYGPFSLADAADAQLHFMYWLNSEPDYDRLFVGASINGANFYGGSISGSYDWTEMIFDLTNVYTIGDLRGQPSVWITLVFTSDEIINYPEGAYIDNVQLLKSIADDATPTPTNTATALFTPTNTATALFTPTATHTPTATSITSTVEANHLVALPVVMNQAYNGPTNTPTLTTIPTLTTTPTITATPTATSESIVPLDGDWAGLTSQGRTVTMDIVSGGTEIDKLIMTVYWGGLCGMAYGEYYYYNIDINNGSFYEPYNNGTWISGTFHTPTTADGDFYIVAEIYYPTYCKATASGSWAAEYVP